MPDDGTFGDHWRDAGAILAPESDLRRVRCGQDQISCGWWM